MRKISPFGWLTLKASLLQGLIKSIIFFLKTEYAGELRISESNLFHLTNADTKKELRKKLFLTYDSEITKLFEGIKSSKYFGECFFNNYVKGAKLFLIIVYFEEILIQLLIKLLG